MVFQGPMFYFHDCFRECLCRFSSWPGETLLEAARQHQLRVVSSFTAAAPATRSYCFLRTAMTKSGAERCRFGFGRYVSGANPQKLVGQGVGPCQTCNARKQVEKVKVVQMIQHVSISLTQLHRRSISVYKCIHRRSMINLLTYSCMTSFPRTLTAGPRGKFLDRHSDFATKTVRDS